MDCSHRVSLTGLRCVIGPWYSGRRCGTCRRHFFPEPALRHWRCSHSSSIHMKRSTVYTLILVFAILGLIMSGYLTYYNLLGPGCHQAIISCGPAPVKIFGLPNCVYGFFMYLTVVALAVVGLVKKQPSRGVLTAELIFGVIGSLFAAGLSVYELWIVNPVAGQLPACVYGFFLYLGVLIVSGLGLREKPAPVSPPGL